MAPTAPTNTDRFYLHYTVSSLAHTLLMRTNGSITPAEASTVFSELLTLLDANLYTLDITGMEFSAAGSNVRNPVAYTGDTEVGAGTAIDSLTRAQAIVFTGRDQSGHAIRLFIYGAKGISDGDYRTSEGENSAVDAALDYLAALSGYFMTVGAFQPVWHRYANITIPIHWQKKLRTV